MKNLLKVLVFAFILTALTLVACGVPSNGSEKSSEKDQSTSVESEESFEESIEISVEVTATVQSVEVKDEALTTFDFTPYFTITEGDDSIEVKGEYISVSEIDGAYTATCTYKEKSAYLTVTVIKTVYEIELSVEEITLNTSLVSGYDFLALFGATKDGEAFVLTEEHVTSDVSAVEGRYSYTVSVGDAVKTLTVIVTNQHDIEIFLTYPEIEISEDELADFDPTVLFSLYVNGEAKRVTADMIDSTDLDGATAGGEYEVSIKVVVDQTERSAKATVRVKQESQIIINARNVVVYPNSEYVDLTKLFEIVKGDQIISVTADMISGTVDYNKEGENVITLSYNGIQKTAIVEVKRGVIIAPSRTETVIVKRGTNKDSYNFENDFSVIINGIRFTAISEYLDTSKVSFDEVGEYTATVSIPYNDQKLGLTSVKFTYYEGEITYVVVNSEYSLSLKQEDVVLAKGTTEYNPFSNVKLVINGRNQSITEIKEYVDPISCYGEILSDPIDFTSNARQRVELALYVYGVDSDPVTVEYFVTIGSDIEVASEDLVVFMGTTVYTTDLFTVTENGEDVEVTHGMITGKVDVFTPGLYTVTISYKGFTKEASVIVLDSGIIGTYRTLLMTIADDETDDEYGFTGTGSRLLRNLFYYEDGSIIVDGAVATVKGVVDSKTTLVDLMRYEYSMYYENGIIVLDPDNSIKLPYNNNKRPMVYFHNQKWNLTKRITVNSGSSYVLDSTISGYSFDIFEITDIQSGETFYYALKVSLVDKSSTDTAYSVDWGFVSLADDFVCEAGAETSFVFNGETYKVVMSGESEGAIKKPSSSDKIFASKTFTGVIDGKDAILRSDAYQGFSLQVDGVQEFKAGSLEIENMKHGGPDYENSSIFLYGFIERNDGEVFSYKFNLNLEDGTFTVDEKDVYFGQYETDGAFIFLDGYGTGVINFDTKSYYKYSFEYTVVGNRIDIEFINTPYNFAYGKRAVCTIESLLNVITINDINAPSVLGKKFVNNNITDGAIVEISSYKVGAGSDTVVKPQFLSYVNIITKDGLLEGDAKLKAIDTSRIKFSTPGFYQFTVTTSVGGEDVESYYAMQVLAPVYEGNPIVATYGNGVIFNSNSLLIDKFGQATLIVGDITFDGLVTIYDDETFVINATNAKGEAVTATGAVVSAGIISLRCVGVATFNDYFTTGTVFYAGAKGFSLRAINVSNNYVYIAASSPSSFGAVAEVEVISGTQNASGSIMKIAADGEVTYVKLDSYGDPAKGLTLADDYRGAYSIDGGEIVFDGFGKFTGESVGSYTLYGRIATVNIGGELTVYRLDNINFKATVVDVKFDLTLVAGKTFGASHSFYCGDYMYSAYTTFEFKLDGTVIIKSTSTEHDEGSDYYDPCGGDTYSPLFASADGVIGSYSVNANKVTVTVNGESFTFEIPNVVAVDSLVCTATTVGYDEHGYFAIGTSFVAL